jgi:hypothetical protein
MQLTVFGATGLVGQRIVKQALAAGHQVKAFGRNVESLFDADIRDQNLVTIKGYVFNEDSVFNAVKGSDAILSALGGSFDGIDKTRSLGIKNIVKQMEKAGVKRIIAVGGMAILNAPDGSLLRDNPDYPAIYKPVGKEHVEAYLYLKESNLDWTIIGAPDLVDGDATGDFVTKVDYPAAGKGKINTGDLALFMILEATKNQFLKCRVGISNTL